jgi:hypothetical protein
MGFMLAADPGQFIWPGFLIFGLASVENHKTSNLVCKALTF